MYTGIENLKEAIKNSGLSYTIIRPGGIRDFEFDSEEVHINKVKAPALIGADNLAKVIVQSILPDIELIDEFPQSVNASIACRGIYY